MTTTRRHFLGAAGAGLGVPLLAHEAQQSPKKVQANDKIQIALIGCGGMGQGDAKTSTSTGLTKIVAACDCYDGRLEHMKEQYGSDIFTTKEYKEILGRKDIDAVIIGTPDHWHQPITIAALKAGKDVYCEKPMVHSVDEGHAVIDAQQQTNRILQIGSQRVSSVVYAKARDLFRQGAIGDLNMVEAWWDRNSAVGAWEYTVPLDADTKTCDWDTFQGSAPKTEWDPTSIFPVAMLPGLRHRRSGRSVRPPLLRAALHYEFSWADASFGHGRTTFLDRWPRRSGRDAGAFRLPKTQAHPAFNLVLRVNFVSGGQENSGFRFIGSKGIMTVGSTVTLNSVPEETEPGWSIDTFSDKTQAEFKKQYFAKYPNSHYNRSHRMTAESLRPAQNEVFAPPQGYSDHFDHHLNWAHAIRSRKPVVEDGSLRLSCRGARPFV